MIMSKITTLIFDMYGVILEESKGNFIPYTYNHFDESEYERITRQFRVEKLFTKAGNGEISSDEFLSLLGFNDTKFHMKDYIENHLTLDAGFIPFAEKFAGQYEFVLLSNDVSEWSAYITEFHGLDKYFTHKIVSGDVKCRKPDKKIYEIALERIGKKPEECLFIDNTAKNLLVAQDLGIVPVMYDRDKEEYEGIKINSFEELAQVIMEDK
ncbi:MAG: HAD-IA family hydrolase [Lachnospiraceae bacterium]|nr:HAD-IA family hydrolase [Lachnospiraceae bacterium]